MSLYECARRKCRHIYQHKESVMVRQPSRPGPKTVPLWKGTCPKCGHEAFYLVKPLFIPLKAEHYDAFARGEKTEEYRLRGNRWNMETCRVGRRVILSRGYGKKHRVTGVITGCHYCTLPASLPGWLDCYGPGAGDATVIQIQLDAK